MQMEVKVAGQLNVEITNVVASDSELDALRTALTRLYPGISDLVAKFDRATKRGQYYIVRFVVPGPMLFHHSQLISALEGVGLVGWHIEFQAGPKGKATYF